MSEKINRAVLETVYSSLNFKTLEGERFEIISIKDKERYAEVCDLRRETYRPTMTDEQWKVFEDRISDDPDDADIVCMYLNDKLVASVSFFHIAPNQLFSSMMCITPKLIGQKTSFRIRQYMMWRMSIDPKYSHVDTVVGRVRDELMQHNKHMGAKIVGTIMYNDLIRFHIIEIDMVEPRKLFLRQNL